MAGTVQDIYNSMSSEQRDAAALIFGAIESDESSVDGNTPVSGNKKLGEVYSSLSPIQKDVIDFIAADIGAVQHSEFVEEFLEHHGVKGMKWGVRKEDRLSSGDRNTAEGRAAARKKVKDNTATLEDAHVAALKSKGHRIANAVLGDKTYWKRAGIILAGAGVGAGASLVAPGLMPHELLQNIGLQSMAASGDHHAIRVGDYTVSTKSYAEKAGKQTVEFLGLAGVAVTAKVASTVNEVSNTVRAIRGNARVNKSYERIGKQAQNHQATGTKKVQKVLKQSGGIKIRHDALDFEDFLEHHGIKGMKWGVRRDPGSDGLVGPPSVHSPGGMDGNPRTSADFERFTTAMAKARTKGISSLSNEELKAVANRIKNENDFSKQTTERALASRSRGRKIIDAFLTKATDTAAEMAAAQGKKLVQEFFDNKNKKPPTALEKIKAENEIMKIQKEHLNLLEELAKKGFYNTPIPAGSGMKVNPAKVKVTPTPLHNLPKLKNQ